MSIFYNIEPFKVDLHAVQGDKILYSFNVTLNGVPFDMSLYVVEMQVRRKDGLLLKKFSSIGTSEITIIIDQLDFYADGFLESGIFDYDLQVRNPGTGNDILTIMYGQQIVQKQSTK